jgi:CHAT domain
MSGGVNIERFEEFRITVVNREKIRYSRPNRMNGECAVAMDRLAERTIRILGEYLSDGSMDTREQLTVLGTHLFRALFDQKLRSSFSSDLQRVKKDPNTGLRLILEFLPDAKELAKLPWEYIYFPDADAQEEEDWGAGFFIAAEPESRLVLARHVPLRIDDLAPAQQPLKILAVVSQPTEFSEGEQELGEVISEPVVRAIEKLKTDNPEAIETELLYQPTKRTLKEKVAEFEPHVVHFIGHGKYDQEKGGSLAFVRDDGKRLVWINDQDLPDCFIPKPRLIFLHACWGAQTASYEAFRGVGLTLAYSQIPAVVAMQYPVENAVANAFAVRFYQSLAEGRPIDAAVQDGRKELAEHLEDKSYDDRAFGVPVVFLQTPEEIIKVAKLSEPLGTRGGPIRCPNDSNVITRNFCNKCGLEFVPCWKCGERRPKGIGYCDTCGQPPEPATVRPMPEPSAVTEPTESGVVALSAAAQRGADISRRSVSGEHKAPPFDVR